MLEGEGAELGVASTDRQVCYHVLQGNRVVYFMLIILEGVLLTSIGSQHW